MFLIPDLLCQFIDEGEQIGFERLVGCHGPMAWQVCRANLLNDSEADDVFQVTFLSLLKSGGTIREQDFAACLYRAA